MPAATRLVFIDAGVLIAAARGNQAVSSSALAVLDDPVLQFASSVFVRLEVLPMPIFNRRSVEVTFYTEFFDGVVVWAPVTDALLSTAYVEAARIGLKAIDALHLAAAAAAGASEFITTERPTSRLHQTNLVVVRSLHP
jgi:predicted nucleic acid-binding protein